MTETRSEATEPGRGAARGEDRGQLLLDLSNAVVRVHKRFYGKGPTKARSHLQQNLLTVILEGGFTRSEQTLHEHGHDREVVQSRLAMRSSVEDQLRTAVEAILGRRIRSFMSAHDPGNDIQAEVFVLEQDGDHTGAEGELGARAQRAREEHRELMDEHRALRAEQVQHRRRVRIERDDDH